MEPNSPQRDVVGKVMVLEAEELHSNLILKPSHDLFLSSRHETDSKYMMTSCVDGQRSHCFSEPHATVALFVQWGEAPSPQSHREVIPVMTPKRVPGMAVTRDVS